MLQLLISFDSMQKRLYDPWVDQIQANISFGLCKSQPRPRDVVTYKNDPIVHQGVDETLLGRQCFGQQMLLVNIYIDLKLFCRQLGQRMVDVGHFHNTPKYQICSWKISCSKNYLSEHDCAVCLLGAISDAGNRRYRIALVSERCYQGKTRQYQS